jgi:ankyrin repeat protein
MYTHVTRKVLISKLSIHLHDTLGASAIHFAAFNGHVSAVTSLLRNGANVNSQNREVPQRCHPRLIRWRVGNRSTMRLTMVTAMLCPTSLKKVHHYCHFTWKSYATGALINSRQNMKMTPLHLALVVGHTKVSSGNWKIVGFTWH